MERLYYITELNFQLNFSAFQDILGVTMNYIQVHQFMIFDCTNFFITYTL